MVKGCVHLHIAKGKVDRIFIHLSDLPMSGVIHLKPDAQFTEDEFAQSHPNDADELLLSKKIFELGDSSIQVKFI
jgi:hypothetical protein